jgi:crossover junction endodeoxyribonuclease RuvC
MNIIGIDPGLEDTGWAVLEDEKDNILLKDFGLIKTDSRLGISKRLKIIYDEISKKIIKYSVKEAAIEEMFFINKMKAQAMSVQARGVIILALENLGVEVYEYNPKAAKKMITGNGNASKNQIVTVVKMTFSIRENLYPDIADSIALALTHLRVGDLKRKNIIR